MSEPRPSQPRSPERPARSRKFRLLLLAYVVLTLLSFWLVQRYAVRVAALYDYDIQNDLLQWTALTALFALVSALAYQVARLLPGPLRSENQLRLTVLAALTFGVIVAVYQSQFGVTPFARLVKFVNFFTFSSLGAFAVVLWLTSRRFGLVEVIARPAPDVMVEVERWHAGLPLARRPWDQAKRGVEILLTLAIIAVSLPLSSLLAVAVWLQDPGPLLVAKVAVKQGGRSFNQYKLRTMVKNAEDVTGPVPASPADARVTRLGNLLRRTHIDELPQMLNILRGDMSLVGPRPERTVFVQRHVRQIQDYPRRHAVRPGLAGLAQVYGDYYSTPREKLRYDLLYFRNRSLGLDLQLFASAVGLALFGLTPRRRGHARVRHRREEQRWRRAYQALRGEGAPDADTARPNEAAARPPEAGDGSNGGSA